jgi:hypothetical protein
LNEAVTRDAGDAYKRYYLGKTLLGNEKYAADYKQ